jgi:hypothetical protein
MIPISSKFALQDIDVGEDKLDNCLKQGELHYSTYIDQISLL